MLCQILRIISEVFTPPNAKLLLIIVVVFRLKPLPLIRLRSANSLSGVEKFRLGANHSCSCISSDIPISMAPQAPKVWPM